MKAKSTLWYTVYSIIGTIFEEAALVAIVLWVLPRFNIHIPWWGLVILMVALAIFSYVSYRIGKPTLVLRPRVAPETIIGSEGKVVTPLAPEGYVKVQGELWKAISAESELEAGNEVVVVRIDGLRLLVSRKEKLDSAGQKTDN
ncbi:MAG TPA: hypothetical protein G4O12_00575 [Dehalococcoidia bacterium]|nr:hypothetical protein [Dehalococcoidia bacterium]